MTDLCNECDIYALQDEWVLSHEEMAEKLRLCRKIVNHYEDLLKGRKNVEEIDTMD